VIHVTGLTFRGGCRRREHFAVVMFGTVVTGFALSVGDFGAPHRGRRMTRRALDHGMRMRDRSGGKCACPATESAPSQPAEPNRGEGDRENPPPARNRKRLLEVVEVEPLRQLLLSTGSSLH